MSLAALLLLILRHQFNSKFCWNRSVPTVRRQLETDSGLPRTCISRDPHGAVTEHSSATLAQLGLRSSFVGAFVQVDQRGQDRHFFRQESIRHGAESIGSVPSVAEKDTHIVSGANNKRTGGPELEPKQ